jgi:hypothetical protein
MRVILSYHDPDAPSKGALERPGDALFTGGHLTIWAVKLRLIACIVPSLSGLQCAINSSRFCKAIHPEEHRVQWLIFSNDSLETKKPHLHGNLDLHMRRSKKRHWFPLQPEPKRTRSTHYHCS